jgi:hypothetical protein
MISSNKVTSFFVVAGLLAAASIGSAQTQNLYIPQIADGGLITAQNWKTTFVITNTSSTASSINSINFYQEVSPGNTQTWNLSLVEAPTMPLSVPAGSTILLHTPATASIISVGWGVINAGPGIEAYAIFSASVPGGLTQDGTGLALPAASRFLVPFDQTLGSVVGLAIANVSSSPQTVTVAVRTSSGTVTQNAITVPALGHFNFPFNSLNLAPAELDPIISAVSGQSGLLEVYTSTASLAVLTLRFNITGAFTAAPVYAEAGPPIIGTAAGSTPPPFSTLFINGTWTLSSTAGSPVIQISPNSNGTYTAGVYELQPFILASFPNGTLSGQTLTFNTIGSSSIYGTSAATSGSLTLTVNNFNQVGSPVTGTMTITTSGGTNTGSITGTSTYEP